MRTTHFPDLLVGLGQEPVFSGAFRGDDISYGPINGGSTVTALE